MVLCPHLPLLPRHKAGQEGSGVSQVRNRSGIPGRKEGRKKEEGRRERNHKCVLKFKAIRYAHAGEGREKYTRTVAGSREDVQKKGR